MSGIEEELTIVARMRDKLSPVIKEVGSKITSFKNKSQGAFKAIGTAARMLGRAFKAMLGPLSLLSAAVTGLGGLIGLGMSRAAAEAEATRGKFDTVFKDLATPAREAAQEIASSFGRSQVEVEQFFATFQDTFVPFGFARDEAAALSEQVTKLAIDLASFNDVTDQQGLEDLQSALVGNVETMRKYGVVINQTVLDQELLRMGIEGGVNAATEQEKVIGRLNLIMAGTADAQGDAVRTGHEFNNTMKSLSAVITEARARFGAFINDAILRAIETMGGRQGFQQVVDTVLGSVSALSVALADIAGGAMRQFVSGVEGLGGSEAIVDKLRRTFEELGLQVQIVFEKIRLAFMEAQQGWLGSIASFATQTRDLEGDLAELQGRLESLTDGQYRNIGAGKVRDPRIDSHIAWIKGEMERLQAQMAGTAAAEDSIAKLTARLAELRSQGTGGDERLSGLTAEATAAKDLAAQYERLSYELNRFIAGQDFSPFSWDAALLGEAAPGPLAAPAQMPTVAAPPQFQGGDGGIFGSIAAASIQNTAAAVAKYNEEVAAAAEMQQKMQMAGAVTNAFTDIATGARSAEESVKGLIAAIARMIVQAKIAQVVFPLFGLPAGGFADGGIVAGGGFTGGGALPVKGYAKGGPIFRSPHMAVIGEGSMNEAAVPLPDGKSIPVTLRGGGQGDGGGGGMVQFVVNATDAASVADLFARNGQALADVMMEQMQRNRTFRASFSGGVV